MAMREQVLPTRESPKTPESRTRWPVVFPWVVTKISQPLAATRVMVSPNAGSQPGANHEEVPPFHRCSCFAGDSGAGKCGRYAGQSGAPGSRASSVQLDRILPRG